MEALGLIGIDERSALFAVRLLSAGIPLTVWDVSSERLASLLRLGAARARDPSDLGGRCRIVLVGITADPREREAWCFGRDGAVIAMAAGSLLVDCFADAAAIAVMPGTATRAERCATRNLSYGLAALIGDDEAARRGQLIALYAVSGSPAAPAPLHAVLAAGADPVISCSTAEAVRLLLIAVQEQRAALDAAHAALLRACRSASVTEAEQERLQAACAGTASARRSPVASVATAHASEATNSVAPELPTLPIIPVASTGAPSTRGTSGWKRPTASSHDPVLAHPPPPVLPEQVQSDPVTRTSRRHGEAPAGRATESALPTLAAPVLTYDPRAELPLGVPAAGQGVVPPPRQGAIIPGLDWAAYGRRIARDRQRRLTSAAITGAALSAICVGVGCGSYLAAVVAGLIAGGGALLAGWLGWGVLRGVAIAGMAYACGFAASGGGVSFLTPFMLLLALCCGAVVAVLARGSD